MFSPSTMQELLVQPGSVLWLDWCGQGTLHPSADAIKVYQELLRSQSTPKDQGDGRGTTTMTQKHITKTVCEMDGKQKETGFPILSQK